MKKIIPFFTFILSFVMINAQEKRTIIIGKTLLDSIGISDVHVINKNTNIGTISNTDGSFEIPVKIGDSIHISHINLEEKLIIISKATIAKTNFIVILEEKTYTLEEFTLEKPRSIFYQDPEITKYLGPKITAKSLGLPFANSVIRENNAVVKFNAGAVLSIDNLINGLNGNTRRKNIVKKIAKEDSELSKIRKYFTDDFFITDLRIKKDAINQFLNYCIDKQIISAFKHQNKIKLTQTLITISKEFPLRIENEDLYLTKQ